MRATVGALTAAIAKGSPQGLAASKALTTARDSRGVRPHADALTEQSARLFVSDEAREGMLAFLQKRAAALGRSQPLGRGLIDGLLLRR